MEEFDFEMSLKLKAHCRGADWVNKALAKRLDIRTEHALDKCPVQNVASFCHLVQSCSVVFSDVESCSVDFEEAVKNVQWTRLNFFCLKKMFSRFAYGTPFARLESSDCAPKNFGAHFKTSVRKCKKIGAQSA